MKPSRRLAALLALVAIPLAGYPSNWLSGGAYRAHFARRALREMEQSASGTPGPLTTLGIPIYSLPDDPASYRALRALVGARARECHAPSDVTSFDCFPWVDAGAASRMLGPYVVQVEWGYVLFPTSGHGTRTTVICLFGWVFEVEEHGIWVT